MKFLVSVILPVYQVEDYLFESLNSIVKQSFKSFEIILVNDGSKDDSIKIALDILKKGKIDYTLINQENKGLASARNIGIKNCKGDWVICIDPDDVVDSNILKRMYNVGISNNLDVVCCNHQTVGIGNINKKASIIGHDQVIEQHHILNQFLKRERKIISPGMLIKVSFIEKNNLYYNENIYFSEDQHFIWRVLLATDRIGFLNDRLYNYLIRSNSIMSSSAENKIISGFDEMKKLSTEITKSKKLQKYLLPRWVIGALHSSTRRMNYKQFYELAKMMQYKKYAIKLFTFPDIRIIILSLILVLTPRSFYQISNKIKNF
jgi:glycosyltransferase involved in cell wall biosynthesis